MMGTLIWGPVLKEHIFYGHRNKGMRPCQAPNHFVELFATECLEREREGERRGKSLVYHGLSQS